MGQSRLVPIEQTRPNGRVKDEAIRVGGHPEGQTRLGQEELLGLFIRDTVVLSIKLALTPSPPVCFCVLAEKVPSCQDESENCPWLYQLWQRVPARVLNGHDKKAFPPDCVVTLEFMLEIRQK